MPSQRTELELTEIQRLTNNKDLYDQLIQNIEKQYLELLKIGATPEEARSILPNSLKTEIIVTMNLREWRHFF